MTLVDRHAMFVEAIEGPLWQLGFACAFVVTAGLTTAVTKRQVLESRPDVVVASLDLGPVNGGKVLSAAVAAGHRVISVTEVEDPFRIGEAYARGAWATTVKATPLDDFVALVNAAMAGGEAGDHDQDDRLHLVQRYWEDRQQRTQAERLASLTRKERDLLELMLAGHGIPEVAHLRTVAEATVRAQSRSMFKKLKVTSQLQAVATARAQGWTAKQG